MILGGKACRQSRAIVLQVLSDPPLESGELVARPRLLRKLEEAAQARLTLVQAPAGYGKTSLLIQWFQALGASRSRVTVISCPNSTSASST